MSHDVGKLGRFVHRLTWDSVPTLVQRAAKLQLASQVAAHYAAARMPETRAVRQAVLDLSGEHSGRSRLLLGGTANPVDAAWVHAAYTMAQDYDDILWMGHTGHSAIWAALAVAEHEDRNGEELLTAIVAANEVGGRLGASSFFGPLNGQMWSFIHLVGAAAATAKLLRLDEAQTTHALAIALAQPGFPLQPGFLKPSSKLLTASTPTAQGIRAAYAARAGMTGSLAILEDQRGFWRRFSFLPLPEMLDDLGELWAMATLACKTYPGCFYFQTTCEAIERLLAAHGKISVADVVEVRIATTKLGCEVTRFARDYAPPSELSTVNVNFDLAWTAACVFVAGTLTGAQHHEEWLQANAAALRAWRDKIFVEHDPRLSAEVIRSSRQLAAGRRALSRLGARELIDLALAYRREYRSSLVTPAELVGAVRAALQAPTDAPDRAPTTDGAIGLAFPARVHVVLGDGRTLTEQLSLPAGSLARPDGAAAIERKFRREVAPHLGAAATETALAATLACEELSARQLATALSLQGKPAQ